MFSVFSSRKKRISFVFSPFGTSLSFEGLLSYDASKSGGPLITHQPVENLWISYNRIPHR